MTAAVTVRRSTSWRSHGSMRGTAYSREHAWMGLEGGDASKQKRADCVGAIGIRERSVGTQPELRKIVDPESRAKVLDNTLSLLGGHSQNATHRVSVPRGNSRQLGSYWLLSPMFQGMRTVGQGQRHPSALDA